LARKRTPVRTHRGQERDNGSDVSGDSLDENAATSNKKYAAASGSYSRSFQDHANDNISFVSGLTADEGLESLATEQQSSSKASRPSGIQKPKKRKPRNPVWKIEPIDIKPYVPVPLKDV
jgi:hypothetical protein